jgi:hypothetical protein
LLEASPCRLTACGGPCSIQAAENPEQYYEYDFGDDNGDDDSDDPDYGGKQAGKKAGKHAFSMSAMAVVLQSG